MLSVLKKGLQGWWVPSSFLSSTVREHRLCSGCEHKMAPAVTSFMEVESQGLSLE